MLTDEENNFSIAFVVFRTNLALVSFANEAQYRWRLLWWAWYILGEFREISIEYQQAWYINKFPSCIGGFVCLVCKIFTSNVPAEVTPRPRNSFNHILSSSWTAGHWDRRGHPGRCWQELRSLTVKSHCFLRFVFRPFPLHYKPSVSVISAMTRCLTEREFSSTGSTPWSRRFSKHASLFCWHFADKSK